MQPTEEEPTLDGFTFVNMSAHTVRVFLISGNVSLLSGKILIVHI